VEFGDDAVDVFQHLDAVEAEGEGMPLAGFTNESRELRFRNLASVEVWETT
jgi:hypothetical protein